MINPNSLGKIIFRSILLLKCSEIMRLANQLRSLDSIQSKTETKSSWNENQEALTEA